MRIIVCIKQVPLLEQMKFDAESKRLIREGVPNNINSFDRRAISEAVRLKAQYGGEIVVVTMGPRQADEALREALMMGCDRAVHMVGREYAGADTLATARALAQACRKIGYDLILCGKVATDAETSQVPPMMAELLDLPQITSITELHIAEDGKSLTAIRDTDEGFETVVCALPAVLTAGERLNKPIRVGPEDVSKADGKPIEVLPATELGANIEQLGASGSPTWVERIYSIEPRRKHIMLAGEPREAAAQLSAQLKTEGWGTGRWLSHPEEKISASERKPFAEGAKAIWVVAETPLNAEGGLSLRAVTRELLGAGIGLANQIEGELAAVVLGHGAQGLVAELAAYGADTVYLADAPALAHYTTDAFAGVLSEAIRAYKPFAVLVGSTTDGRDLAPRVAARLGLGLTGDAIGLEIDAQGRLLMLKPAFGGNIIAPILCKTTPAMATVRAGMLSAATPDTRRTAKVVPLALGAIHSRTSVTREEIVTEEGLAMEHAEIVIGIGMGIGGPENLPRIQAFAQRLDAHIVGTRKVVDAGWLPRQVQVGLTGRSIAPRLYISLGVGGQFNHNVGIQRAGVVVAVNNDAGAPIFQQADYGLVCDWREFVDAFEGVVAS